MNWGLDFFRAEIGYEQLGFKEVHEVVKVVFHMWRFGELDGLARL